MKRCEWVGSTVLEKEYHDSEWGYPVHDDRLLFEFLILEGSQAGLSWLTILKKREGYREAFDNFQAEEVARYSEARIARLLLNPAIVRNRLKVNAAVTNARAFLAIQEGFGSFDHYIWRFVDGRPVQNSWKTMAQVPASSPQSDGLSRDLKKKRLQVCRHNYLLRLYAGRRHG